MRSFEQLRATDTLRDQGENSLGTVYWRREGGPAGTIVQRFEHAGAAAVAAYVSLHEAAHQWVHDDDESDAWYIFDVDEPLEVGTDFVIVRRRVGNSLASFLSYDDPAPQPPRVAELRALLPELLAAAATPTDRWIARLVADRIARPSHEIIFERDESLFRIQDLEPTRDELEDWARVSRAAPRRASAGRVPRIAPHPR